MATFTVHTDKLSYVYSSAGDKHCVFGQLCHDGPGVPMIELDRRMSKIIPSKRDQAEIHTLNGDLTLTHICKE